MTSFGEAHPCETGDVPTLNVPAPCRLPAHVICVAFPLASDFWPHGVVSRAYGVFDEARGRSQRAVFVVDPAGAVRYIDIHALREVPEEEQIIEVVERIGRG